jgi:hypothetical protein
MSLLFEPTQVVQHKFVFGMTLYTRSLCSRAHLSTLTRTISETFHGRKRVYDLDQDKLKSRWDAQQDQRRWLSKGKSLFMSMFMPIGYPHSVHSVYAKVHLWQFIETMMGSAVIVHGRLM